MSSHLTLLACIDNLTMNTAISFKITQTSIWTITLSMCVTVVTTVIPM